MVTWSEGRAVWLWQAVIGFGWMTALSFVGIGLSIKSLWILIAVLPFLVAGFLVIETIGTAQLTKVGSHHPVISHRSRFVLALGGPRIQQRAFPNHVPPPQAGGIIIASMSYSGLI